MSQIPPPSPVPPATGKTGKGKWLWILLGAMLLLSCCCVGSGVGVLFWRYNHTENLHWSGEIGAHTTVGPVDPGNLSTLFPPDVPIMEGATLQESSTSDIGSDLIEIQGGFTLNQSVKDVAGFYRKQLALKGWENKAIGEGDDQVELRYEKPERQLSINVYKRKMDDESERTQLDLSLSEPKKLHKNRREH